jgi:hypothetical protein
LTAAGGKAATAALVLASCLCYPLAARAGDDQEPPPSSVFLRLAAGPAYMRERWHVDGVGDGAADTLAWGPALEVTVGRKLASRWLVAGSLQLTGIFHRGEAFRGHTYQLSSVAHLIDVLAGLVDYRPNLRWMFHFGGSLGIVAASEIDTYNGATQTNWGVAASIHGGQDLFRLGRWSIGFVARLVYYRYVADGPARPTTFNGLLPSLLVAFTRD